MRAELTAPGHQFRGRLRWQVHDFSGLFREANARLITRRSSATGIPAETQGRPSGGQSESWLGLSGPHKAAQPRPSTTSTSRSEVPSESVPRSTSNRRRIKARDWSLIGGS